MASERWLPLKYELPDGTRTGVLAASGRDWQIYRTGPSGRVLVARAGLADRWVAEGFLPESALVRFDFGQARFACIGSGDGYELSSVGEHTSPATVPDALAFAASLAASRTISPAAPFHDALYLERLSRLLPTWTVSERVDDPSVLGLWLTGGVDISALCFRRLCALLGWMRREDIASVIATAGLSPPASVERILPRSAGDGPSPAEIEPADASGRPERNEGFRLPGRPELEAFFNEYVVDLARNAERYSRFGIGFPGAILLHGPPGCGKTYAVERLVEYLDWPIFRIESGSVGSPFIHETSRKVAEVFERAAEAAPSLLVIDEMEAFLSDRQLHQSTGLHHVEEVAEFLRRIPEAAERQVLVIGMTNRLEMIDPAILRRGRFDHMREVGMPSEEEVTALLNALLQQLPLSPNLSIAETARHLAGRPLSDAAFVVREAARLCARGNRDDLDQVSLDLAFKKLPGKRDDDQRPIGFVWE